MGIIRRINSIYFSSNETNAKPLLRRIALIAANGGVPAQLLEFVPELGIKSGFFSTLPLEAWEEIELSNVIDRCFNDYRNYFRVGSSEATARGLFWDPVLVHMLTCGSINMESIEIDLEWKMCQPDSKIRIVDFAVLSSRFNRPIFVVEVGTEHIEFPFAHKDSTKLFSIMTLNCIDLCCALQETNLDPSQAKIFGLWIGGPRFQFAVAQPVFTEDDDSEFSEIHIVITTIDHWQMSAFEGDDYFTDFKCTEPCCNSSAVRLLESSRPNPQPTITPGTDEEQYYTDDSDSIFRESEAEESFTVFDTNIEVEGFFHENQRPQINLKSMKKLNVFINCLKDEAHRLDNLNIANSLKKIKSPSFRYVSKGLASASSVTPFAAQVQFPFNQNVIQGRQRQLFPSDTTNALIDELSEFKISKKNSYESILYLQHFKCMYLFPHLIDLVEEGDGKVLYTFELLSPIIDRKRIVVDEDEGLYYFYEKLPLGPYIREESFESLLLDSILFTVHTLYGLHVLHKIIGFIHSDLSPNNVMFSPRSKIWKLIDFNYSLPVEESLVTKRYVGTRGFIAPESKATGIYTEKSDIYSLGEVIRSTFGSNLSKEYETSKIKNAQNTIDIMDFKKLTMSMKEFDPHDRVSVLDALSEAFSFLNRLLKREAYKSFSVYGNDNLLPEVKRTLSNHFQSDEIPLNKIK